MISDILSIVRKGPEVASKLDAIKINNKSVARGANDSTFQFPILTSDTITIDVASVFAASMDRVYATFVQSWLSLHPVIDISIDQNPVQYLKKFHQNIKLEKAIEDLSVDKDEYSNMMEKVYNGEYRLFTNESKTYGILFNVAESATKEMLDNNQDYIKEFLADFDLNPFNKVFTEDGKNFQTSGDLAQAIIDGKRKQLNDQGRKDNLQATDRIRSPLLTDRDIKRANDMIPFGIQCHLMAVNSEGEFVQYMDFIVGVKAVLHVVKADDMIENIINVLQNRNAFFKFLKWTTGEISLFKNMILDLDNIKFDASARSRGRTPWFSTLKRLKERKMGIKSNLTAYGIIPNSTIVISSYEANYLEQKFGINVRDNRTAKKLIKGLFLMTFAIIDDGTRTIDIMYDGSDDFQTYALESLEKEVSMNSNKLGREIGRMISH